MPRSSNPPQHPTVAGIPVQANQGGQNPVGYCVGGPHMTPAMAQAPVAQAPPMVEAQPQRAMQVMQVQVPQGMQGGMPLQVQTPGGVMHVQIPPGLQPGMVFEMQVPMSQPTIAPQPMAMYGGGGEVVQGETGADFQGATYCGDGIVSIELDRRPVVQPGTEHMTIAGEMHEDCCGCGNPNFDMQYQPGKVAITESEFDAAIMEMNSVLKRPLWWYLCYPLVCPLSVCTGERLGLYETTGPDLQRKAKQLSNKYAAQGVKFSIRRKQERIVDTDDYFGELDADISDTFFLLVRQGVVQR